MVKKKISKKYKVPVNIYDDAGWLSKGKEAFKSAFSSDNLGSTIGSLAGATSSIIGSRISNSQIADTRDLESNIEAAQSYRVGASDNDTLMNEWGSWSPMENVNWRDLKGTNTGQQIVNTIGGIGSGAAAGATIGGPIGAIVGGATGLLGSIFGAASANRKAKRKARELNEKINYANRQNILSFENRADIIDTQNDLLALANYAAKGGKIYIKPQNIGENMFDSGGLMHQHGGIFSNDIITIGNGGTHEENPFDGVQIGVDSQGIPNMVEEGEVIWNDYVFSNRLKPTQEFKDKYKVKGETFADVAKNIQKESEERPNDPISKSGLEDSMMKLQIEQEGIRMKDNRRENKNLFAGGGPSGMDPSLFEDKEDLFIIPTGSKLPGNPLIDEVIVDTKAEGTSEEGTNNNTNKLSWLRYAPVVGSALGVIENLFSKPDYSNANLVMEAANKAGEYSPISYTPIGNYLDYTPLDRNYYTNKLAGQAGATRRAIVNQSAGNRATAMAGLLAADYNTQDKYGDLIRQAEEFNLAQRQAVEQFNRATNQANAEMELQASRYNQAARQAAAEARLKGVAQAAALRDAEDKQRAISRSANLTNLFDNLGGLGKESFIMDMIKDSPALLYDWRDTYKGAKKACGGYLTIKNKKRGK